jgi:hypothetical protein
MSCPPPHWLDQPLTDELTNRGTTAPSAVVPATTVAVCAQTDRANRGQISVLTSRARQNSGSLSKRRPSEEWPELANTCRARHHSG